MSDHSGKPLDKRQKVIQYQHFLKTELVKLLNYLDSQ
jgi:hypothetical protein